MRIALLSDTHGYLDEAVINHLERSDEIWHAGDIGGIEVVEKLEAIAPLKAVYGNIDDYIVRRVCPENLIFEQEGLKVVMTHIGGYPGRYNSRIRSILIAEQADLYICGHSHILKIVKDKKLNCLHINPGACGHHGFHIMRTLVRFTLKSGSISDMEVVELGRRGQL